MQIVFTDWIDSNFLTTSSFIKRPFTEAIKYKCFDITEQASLINDRLTPLGRRHAWSPGEIKGYNT